MIVHWLVQFTGLTLGVADAAVADAGAAPPLHRLQVLVVPEASLLHRRRQVLHHRVELAQHVAQVLLVHGCGCGTQRGGGEKSQSHLTTKREKVNYGNLVLICLAIFDLNINTWINKHKTDRKFPKILLKKKSIIMLAKYLLTFSSSQY